MKMVTAKNLAIALTVSALMTSTASFAAKKGGDSGGGGDAEEARVNEIRADILSWIEKGGARELALPADVSIGDYEDKMTGILEKQKVAIAFTNEAVKVKGVEKTCRGAFVIEKKLFGGEKKTNPQILCNIERFKNTEESKQYPLIHHEYAGLVNIERNDGAASDYEISNQITDFLEVRSVKRLAVKKKPEVKPKRDASLEEKYVGNVNTYDRAKTLNECKPYHEKLEKELLIKRENSASSMISVAIANYYSDNGLSSIEDLKVIKKSLLKNEKESKMTIEYEIVVTAKEDSSVFSLVHTIYNANYKINYSESLKHYVDKLGRIKAKSLDCTVSNNIEYVATQSYPYSVYRKEAIHEVAVTNNETNHSIRLGRSLAMSELLKVAYETSVWESKEL